jgi:hypothetical protein
VRIRLGSCPHELVSVLSGFSLLDVPVGGYLCSKSGEVLVLTNRAGGILSQRTQDLGYRTFRRPWISETAADNHPEPTP